MRTSFWLPPSAQQQLQHPASSSLPGFAEAGAAACLPAGPGRLPMLRRWGGGGDPAKPAPMFTHVPRRKRTMMDMQEPGPDGGPPLHSGHAHARQGGSCCTSDSQTGSESDCGAEDAGAFTQQQLAQLGAAGAPHHLYEAMVNMRGMPHDMQRSLLDRLSKEEMIELVAAKILSSPSGGGGGGASKRPRASLPPSCPPPVGLLHARQLLQERGLLLPARGGPRCVQQHLMLQQQQRQQQQRNGGGAPDWAAAGSAAGGGALRVGAAGGREPRGVSVKSEGGDDSGFESDSGRAVRQQQQRLQQQRRHQLRKPPTAEQLRKQPALSVVDVRRLGGQQLQVSVSCGQVGVFRGLLSEHTQFPQQHRA